MLVAGTILEAKILNLKESWGEDGWSRSQQLTIQTVIYDMSDGDYFCRRKLGILRRVWSTEDALDKMMQNFIQR